MLTGWARTPSSKELFPFVYKGHLEEQTRNNPSQNIENRLSHSQRQNNYGQSRPHCLSFSWEKKADRPRKGYPSPQIIQIRLTFSSPSLALASPLPPKVNQVNEEYRKCRPISTEISYRPTVRLGAGLEETLVSMSLPELHSVPGGV